MDITKGAWHSLGTTVCFMSLFLITWVLLFEEFMYFYGMPNSISYEQYFYGYVTLSPLPLLVKWQ